MTKRSDTDRLVKKRRAFMLPTPATEQAARIGSHGRRRALTREHVDAVAGCEFVDDRLRLRE
jgi:hypothetical protein